MRLIIAGSRHFMPPVYFIDHCVARLPWKDKITEVVSGNCDGVDREGAHWASHMKIPVRDFPAPWKELGKRAGPIRNGQMADYADALLLIWDGKSRGSASMKQEMVKRKKRVFEVIMREVW